MPRPRKCRKVCRLPIANSFISNAETDESVVLTVDEYECLRLVDHQGFSQEECAEYMQVSRATAQLICDRARKKLASALVCGYSIRIEGGDYRICDGEEESCRCGGCEKHILSNLDINTKGVNIMRIAVTHKNDQIFGHFGHTEQFKIYDTEDNKVINKTVVDTKGQGHGALASLLKELGADVLICGGIGGGAQNALKAAGIKLYGGVSGSCDEAVCALLSGNLDYDPNAKCDHHDHEHGHGEHSCGDHGCGKGCGEHHHHGHN